MLVEMKFVSAVSEKFVIVFVYIWDSVLVNFSLKMNINKSNYPNLWIRETNINFPFSRKVMHVKR